MTLEDQLHVMLVEDTPVIQKLVLKMLKHLKCHVETANDGKEALERCEKFHFDLILMDVNMPRLNGYETTAEIRKNQEGKSVRSTIVALTTMSSSEEVEESYAAGMDSHMVKPFDLNDLKKEIEKAKAQRTRTCLSCYYQRTCIHSHRPNRSMACWKQDLKK